MVRLFIAYSIFMVMIFGTLPAHAAGCAKRDKMVERLQTRYSETLTGGGLQATRSAQTIVEVWSSKETGTFTVILTTPEGLACVVATGTDWFEATEIADTQS